LEEIIGTSTLGESTATRMMWGNVVTLFGLAVIWACLAFGTKVTGRIAYFTMGIPIIVLAAF
jgi:ABC-type dipeptide/oligopeptide/nickel transport system permease subunit